MRADPDHFYILVTNLPAIITAAGSLVAAIGVIVNIVMGARAKKTADATREELQQNTGLSEKIVAGQEQSRREVQAARGLSERIAEEQERNRGHIIRAVAQATAKSRAECEAQIDNLHKDMTARIVALQGDVTHWRGIAEAQLAEHNNRIIANAERIEDVAAKTGEYPAVKIEPEKQS